MDDLLKVFGHYKEPVWGHEDENLFICGYDGHIWPCEKAQEFSKLISSFFTRDELVDGLAHHDGYDDPHDEYETKADALIGSIKLMRGRQNVRS